MDIQAVLNDADRRQIREEAMKRWPDDLRALAYGIEDVLDEFEAKANELHQTSPSEVCKLC